MSAMGMFFMILIVPLMYFIVVLSGWGWILYDPVIRIGSITAISILYGIYTFRKKYTRRNNDYLENLALQSGRIEEKDYFFTAVYNDKAKVTVINTYIEGIYGHDFLLKFEGRLERFFKSMGLSPECQSGDTRFDETVYIVSDDPWLCSMLQGKSELRTLLYDIFWCQHREELKVTGIRCFDGRIIVTSQYRGNGSDDAFVREYTRAIAQLLQNVVYHIPSRGSIEDRMYREPSGYAAHMFNIVIMALVANGGVVLFMEMMAPANVPHLVNSFSVIPMSFKISAFIVLLLMFAAFIVLRQSSRFAPTSSKILTLGAVGVMLTSIAEVKDVNIRMDSSRGQEFQTQIIGKEAVHHRKRGTTYHLYLNPWNMRNGRYDLVVSHELYARANEGDGVRIREHQGFLDYPWIETIEIVPGTLQSVPPSLPIERERTDQSGNETDWDVSVNRQESQNGRDRTYTQAKQVYGDTLNHMDSAQKTYIIRNFKRIREITQAVMDKSQWDIPPGTYVKESNEIEFYLHPDGRMSDVRFVTSSTLPLLNDITRHTMELAHVQFPKPEVATLIRFRVNFEIGTKEQLPAK